MNDRQRPSHLQRTDAPLTGCVRRRLNVIVSGGTGSGKTTLLNMLSRDERIAAIEDAAELRFQQRNVARMETRAAPCFDSDSLSTDFRDARLPWFCPADGSVERRTESGMLTFSERCWTASDRRCPRTTPAF